MVQKAARKRDDIPMDAPERDAHQEDMVKISTLLREGRESAGKTLQDAADTTRIRKVYLQAIENADFNALPQPIYVRGYLKTYARYLKLDAEKIVQQYDAVEGLAPVAKISNEVMRDPGLRKGTKPSRWLVWVGVLLGAAVFLLFGNDERPDSISEVEPVSPLEKYVVAANDMELNVLATDRVRVRVYSEDGLPLMPEQILFYGDVLFIPKGGRQQLLSDHPEKIEIYADGRYIPHMEVLMKTGQGAIVLDRARMIQSAAQ